MDNSINHNLFKKNSPPQLNQEGLIKINQAYENGLRRIKEIYWQEVIKTEAVNTKGRRKLSVIKTKVSDLSKKSKKKTIPENNDESSQVLQDPQLNLKRKYTELDSQENVGSQPQPKHRRIGTTEEEKEI
ncbi:hypothetical protein Glove_66g76 [Diversispora epigaea]|uniref:Uncharacterized protein n=1 Tax=Diversispora epigaea TaxID=1348612 RepID=A0A397JHG3_9GLOM|nr:hypothetical protein Glove_66g76 [Diversispora epigaea]